MSDRRRIVGPLAVGLAAIGLSFPSAVFPAEPVDISGTWHRNPSLSDDPHEVMKAARAKAGGDREGFGGRGGGRGMPGGGPPGGGGSRGRLPRGDRSGGPAGGPMGAGGFRDLASPGDTLSIEVKPTEIRLEGGEAGLRILRPDGRKQTRQGPGGGEVQTQTEWRGGSLVVESRSGRGMKTTETYTLTQDGKSLEVIVRLEGGPFREPIEFHTHYDAAGATPEPEEEDVEGPPAPPSSFH